MKRVLAVTAGALLGVAVLSAPAAAGTVCYKVAVIVNDGAVVAEEGCESVG